MAKGKYKNSPTGGKHEARGSNAEGPFSNNVSPKGSGRTAQLGGNGGAGNKGGGKGINVVSLMSKGVHHTTE